MKTKEKASEQGSPVEKEAVLKTTDTVVEAAPKKAEEEKPCTDTIGNQVMTASQFATIANVGVHTMFWVNKTYDATETKAANEWSNLFLKEGAIAEAPEILKEKAS